MLVLMVQHGPNRTIFMILTRALETYHPSWIGREYYISPGLRALRVLLITRTRQPVMPYRPNPGQNLFKSMCQRELSTCEAIRRASIIFCTSIKQKNLAYTIYALRTGG